MPKPPKKEYEFWQLRRFKECYRAFPDGQIASDEIPDFLIETHQGCVGIELTNFYRPASPNERLLQEQESLRSQVVERAESLYAQQSRPALNVHVFFNHTVAFRKADISRLSDKLFAICANFSKDVGVELLKLSWRNISDFPLEFSSIFISRRDQGFWVVQPGMDIAPECTVADVQHIIDKKNKRYPICLKKCNEVWLVIVIEGGNLSSLVDIPRTTQIHRYQSEFDRVYIFLNFDSYVVELNVS